MKALETSAFTCIWRAFRSSETGSRKGVEDAAAEFRVDGLEGFGEVREGVEELAGVVVGDPVVRRAAFVEGAKGR